MMVEAGRHDLKEMQDLINSDEETGKAFRVLIHLVERNHPWYEDAERKVLERMVERGCKSLEKIHNFIMNLYFHEKAAGPVYKPVSVGGVRI